MTKNHMGSTGKKYSPEAYQLVLDALNHTVELLQNGKIKPVAPYADNRATDQQHKEFHISGQELLEGFKLHVREEYGNMALFLLERWGIKNTEDVGNIVFEMVESGRMSKRENDSIDDFKDKYDFQKVFGSSDEAEE